MHDFEDIRRTISGSIFQEIHRAGICLIRFFWNVGIFPRNSSGFWLEFWHLLRSRVLLFGIFFGGLFEAPRNGTWSCLRNEGTKIRAPKNNRHVVWIWEHLLSNNSNQAICYRNKETEKLLLCFQLLYHFDNRIFIVFEKMVNKIIIKI